MPRPICLHTNIGKEQPPSSQRHLEAGATLAHPRLPHGVSLSSAPLPEIQTPEAGVYRWDRTAASRLTLEDVWEVFLENHSLQHTEGETKNWKTGSLDSGNTAQPLTFAPDQWIGKGMCVKD